MTPPDVVIVDTQEVLREYQRLTANLGPLGLQGIDTWMSLVVDAVGVEEDIAHNTALMQYEMAGDFLYEERPEGNAIIHAAQGLIQGVYGEFKRNGLYDEHGLLPWLYNTLTADDCIVLLYYNRFDSHERIPRSGNLGF